MPPLIEGLDQQENWPGAADSPERSRLQDEALSNNYPQERENMSWAKAHDTQDLSLKLSETVRHLDKGLHLLKTFGLTYADGEYRQAIKEADTIDQSQVSGERKAIKDELKTETNPTTRRELVQRDLELHDMQRAPGYTRANLGLVYLRNGLTAEGVELLLAANRLDPEMERDPNFQRHLRLLNAQLPTTEINGSYKGQDHNSPADKNSQEPPKCPKPTPFKDNEQPAVTNPPSKTENPPLATPQRPPEGPSSSPPRKPEDSVPPISNSNDLKILAHTLRLEHNTLTTSFQSELKDKGFIGSLWNFTKNTIGSSSAGRHWWEPQALWSNLINFDFGSDKVARSLKEEEKKIAALELAAQNNDTGKFAQIYNELTGTPYNPLSSPHAHLSLTKSLGAFKGSQRNGVETITDISAGLASGAFLACGPVKAARSIGLMMGVGFGVGGITKAGLKQLDGQYASFNHDFITGGALGAIMPIAELGGAQVSRGIANRYGLTLAGDFLATRIETQGAGIGIRLLSASAKSGTTGAIFGALESPAREILQAYETGNDINTADLLKHSLAGAAFGFVGGTAFGLTFDGLADGFKRTRRDPITPSAPTEINGVTVPSSGITSFDDAARILGKDPTDMKSKALSDPWGAVADSVELFENTGLNIQKFDPHSGKPVLPKAFSEALGTVQTVDTMTAEAKTPLSNKVKIVKSADEFVSSNGPVINESLERVTGNQVFRDVVDLKRVQQGEQQAQDFANKVRDSFVRDVKVCISVQRIQNSSISEASALGRALPETEARYLAKAADFFKDMTDPAARERLNLLVDEVFDKFTPRPLSIKDLSEMIERVPEADRSLAYAILQHSMRNSSDVALKAQLNLIKGELSSAVPFGHVGNVYTLSADSSGNLLGYLFRKSNSMSMSIHNLDELASQAKSGNLPDHVILFDDLSTTPITEAQRQLLAKVPKVYVVDLHAFDKGLNVLDFAMGTQAVEQKLGKLVNEARKIAGSNQQVVPTGVAQHLFDGAVDEVANNLGPNVKVIRPPSSAHISGIPSKEELAALEPTEAIYRQLVVPKASKEEIASFLSNYAGDERELAARMLKEGAVHNSFQSMSNKAKAVYEQLSTTLAQHGRNMNDLFLVVDKDPGGSTHLITYLFGKINGLSKDNFVSSRALNDLVTTGNVKGKVVAYLDDTIYSGSQTRNMLDNNISSFLGFDRIVVGSLGAYDKGLKAISGTHLAKIGKVSVVPAEIHHPFYSSSHPFYRQLTAQDQFKVKQIGGSGGFGDVQGSLIWSYMYPDNNLEFFGHHFAGGVLHLPGP